ncbi:MAG: pyridoxal phosphate-dependent aminotransferase [Acidobacteriota bacterium]|nr:pyridoxal phosphate-dependent aminotransferase [Acidobacteriota bacterium]
MNVLDVQETSNLLNKGFSRRSLGRFAAMLTAGATLPFYNESAMAQLSMIGPIPADAVKINANENPLGPCPQAAEAIYSVTQKGGRYLYEETFSFAKTLADIEGVKAEYVLPFAGSSDPLHRVVMAFTSPKKSFVVADPGYEAGSRAADFVGAKVVRVPLTSDFAHDVKAMAAADSDAGVVYLCNPNNPTGTLTPRSDIEWILANKPKGSILLLDEAYLHFSNATPGTDLVAADKDVIVLRTFSKLFGMAGLRAGAAIARPDLLAKIKTFGAGALPVTGMVGANASLQVKTLVPERRKNMRTVREDTFSFLAKKNIQFIPSDSNCFMLDAKRPGMDFVKAMAAEKVYVGRVWPSMPTYSRITVGTSEEMAKFKTAVSKVMA